MIENFEKLKANAIDRIRCLQTPEELYEFLCEETPFEDLAWNCEICGQYFEPCEETMKTDEKCIERFSEWCKRHE